MNNSLTVMYLNVHGGITLKQLLQYLAAKTSEVDVFCFQEVPSSPVAKWSIPHPNGACPNLYQKLGGVLHGFQGTYQSCQSNRQAVDNRLSAEYSFGLATFVRREMNDIQSYSERIYQPDAEYGIENHGTVPRDILCTRLTYGGVPLTIANVHGLWDPQGKIDTPARLEQSLCIAKVLDRYPDRNHILGGDFNLLPDSLSLTQFYLKRNMRNLITDFKITNTRSTTQYQKPGRFADYVFVDRTLTVSHFEVDGSADDASDHLPLIVTISF